MRNQICRKPYETELKSVAELMSETTGEPYGDVVDKLIYGSTVVFPHYATDTPGYTGRVMVVVWPGGPELVSVFTFDEDGNPRKEDITDV